MKHLFFLLAFLLVLISNSYTQVWVKPNGRVGIGDQEPIAKLQVNSTSTFSNPGIAILDSSASETQGGILQFRSVPWDGNHFNLRGSLSQYASGLDSKFDLFFRENLLMSVTATSTTNQHLLYNSEKGSLRAGYLSIGSIGEYSIAAGYNNTASGTSSTAFGGGNQATGQLSTVLGGASTASESYATAIGYENIASGPFSLAAGRQALASNVAAFAMGDSTRAFGSRSFATGYKTLASGDYATATGSQTTASGLYSLAGGFATTASNTSSMAFGFVSSATGVSATALGYSTLAAGENALAINSVTKALGPNSFTSGFDTKTDGWMTSAFGESTTARSYASAVFGRFNDTISTSDPNFWYNEDPLFMIGNGSSNTERNNALTIYKNGSLLAEHPTGIFSDPGDLAIPVSTYGTRLMWIPEKSAFRVGTVNGNQWSAENIAPWSFASGFNAEATGDYSVAIGNHTRATGTAAVSMGDATEATVYGATAFGSASKATGYAATATGAFTVASGIHSTAMGSISHATGGYSTAIGLETRAKSYAALAIGAFNDSISTSSNGTWDPTDPLIMVGNGTDDANRHNAFTIYKNGNLLAKNPTTVTTDPGLIDPPVSGAGTRMMWMPEKSAYRVGTVNNDAWDAGNIGPWSFASGFNAQASENYTTSIGYYTNAAGVGSSAIGWNTNATGLYSLAMGFGTLASDDWSTAMGSSTEASGTFATAMGWSSLASGEISTAMGTATIAKAYRSTAIGSYNDEIAGSSEVGWVETDPLFYIGNADESPRSNAMVVYKNANTDISGYTRLGKESEDAPRIKMKELPLSLTGANYNSAISIPHGLTAHKILSVSVLVEWDTDLFAPPEYSASLNLRYNYYVNATSVVIQNNTPMGDCLICDRFVKVLVTYKE